MADVAMQVRAIIPILCQSCNTRYSAGQLFNFNNETDEIQCPNCKEWTKVTVEGKTKAKESRKKALGQNKPNQG